MADKRIAAFHFVLGLVVACYCSHAFGIKPLAQNYSAIKPDLAVWQTQTTASHWYGYSVVIGDEGLSMRRPPVTWDFFIEMVIFLSGSLAFLRMEDNEPSNRNIMIIFKSLFTSILLLVVAVVVESLPSTTTILPANSLLVWLAGLNFLGRMLLFLPIRKAKLLLPVGMLFLVIHWATVQYGFGTREPVAADKNTPAAEDVTEVHSGSAWEYESGVLTSIAATLDRVLPVTVRNSSLEGEYENYSEVNVVAYLGLYLTGMATAALCLGAVSVGRVLVFLFCGALIFFSLSVGLQLLDLPAVPRLASPPHILLACAAACSLLAVGHGILAIRSSEKICFPILALGALSGVLYVLERAVGVVFRTEVDKHLEPLLKPLFGEAWLKWEPIIFYNLVFLVFATGCIYLYRKRIHFHL